MGRALQKLSSVCVGCGSGPVLPSGLYRSKNAQTLSTRQTKEYTATRRGYRAFSTIDDPLSWEVSSLE